MKKLIAGLVGVLVVVGTVFALYTVLMLHWSYSDGERAGYLQKLSKKGWLCKTYEGEMAMTSVPGVAPTLWKFTVRDEQLADKLNQRLGEKVVVHYEEHVGLPTRCFGETDYFIVAVK